jgi:penicillin-binding protein 2
MKIMQDALQGVCNEPGGTGYYRRPRGVKFKVAGKTGTAQVVKQGDDRGKDLPYDFRDHAWFAAYAPADDPRIAVAVVNEHGGHGSSGAAPLAMELITYYLEQVEKEDMRAEATEE